MDDKVFLGKYRVPAEQVTPAGDLTGGPAEINAEEVESGKKVVVELVSTGPLNATALERLAAEAIAAKKLSHANIPALYDFGVEDDHLVYVAEDFEGTLAEEWVNSYGPMPVGSVLRVASQVVSALSAAAVHQIVHPAINPGNLMLVPGQTEDGEWPLVKVLHLMGDAPTLSGASMAVAAFDKSLHYVSPEQIKDGTVDFRSEIYSLGCTMWFLLTGAPPLVTAKGPQVQATTPGAGKVSDVPRKVRRLLARMLSANPETRPHDPIEFYRKLQECLAQVERREERSQRFGVPVFFRAPTSAGTVVRRPMKALARAALFLGMAALAGLAVSGYIRHRIVSGQEPPGVLIGVPEAVGNATALGAIPPSPAAPTSKQEAGLVARSNIPSAGTVGNDEVENKNAFPPPVSSAENADRNQITQAPQSAIADLSPNANREEPAAATVGNASEPPPTSPSETASTQVAVAPPPESSPDTIAQPTPPNDFAMHEVRRAEPADLEVRPAEPAPPEEGPESTSPTNATAQTAGNRDGESKPAKKTPLSVKRTVPKSRAIARQPAKGQRPKRPLKERIYLPADTLEFSDSRSPGRSVQARFVGVTPDGMWMLALPSNEIVVVPPPRAER